jgi:hypothetical protein
MTLDIASISFSDSSIINIYSNFLDNHHFTYRILKDLSDCLFFVINETQWGIGLHQIELTKLIFKLGATETFHELEHLVDLVLQKKSMMYGFTCDWLSKTDWNHISSCLWLLLKVLFYLINPCQLFFFIDLSCFGDLSLHQKLLLKLIINLLLFIFQHMFSMSCFVFYLFPNMFLLRFLLDRAMYLIEA